MLSAAKRVAPGKNVITDEALKERNKMRRYFALSVLFRLLLRTRGDALRFAQRLPLAIIFRTFGAALAFIFRAVGAPDTNAGGPNHVAARSLQLEYGR